MQYFKTDKMVLDFTDIFCITKGVFPRSAHIHFTTNQKKVLLELDVDYSVLGEAYSEYLEQKLDPSLRGAISQPLDLPFDTKFVIPKGPTCGDVGLNVADPKVMADFMRKEPEVPKCLCGSPLLGNPNVCFGCTEKLNRV